MILASASPVSLLLAAAAALAYAIPALAARAVGALTARRVLLLAWLLHGLLLGWNLLNDAPRFGFAQALSITVWLALTVYAVESHLILHGLDPAKHMVVVKSRDGRTIEEGDIAEAMTDEVALAVLPSVLYRSGQLLDMQYLTKEAHKRGILIGFDCCHSVGAVPHSFSEWGVDFAFWCNYKYLNSGPGATAGLYINSRHFDKAPGLWGWWGYDKAKQFDMAPDFRPAPDAGAWQIGTVHLFSTAPLYGSMNIFDEAGIHNIREKSLNQTGYLMFLIDSLVSREPYNFRVGTPREPRRRGGHVALEHDTEAVRINAALKKRGVIPDFRFPNVIRLAPIALYTSYHEIWQVVQHIKEIMDTREYQNFPRERGTVS